MYIDSIMSGRIQYV